MNSNELTTIAKRLIGHGAPIMPTILLTRETPIFEVEFDGLEFVLERNLSACDRAVLELARALGRISAADVDGYLGVGESVAEALVSNLAKEGLLHDCSETANMRSANQSEFPIDPLSGVDARSFDRSDAPRRRATSAALLGDSLAARLPEFHCSAKADEAILRGTVEVRHRTGARLLFVLDPLIFVGVADEKRNKHSVHQRPRPMPPEDVPEALRYIADHLNLQPTERAAACGIANEIRGIRGRFVGVVPGSQWEVRKARHGRDASGESLAQVHIAGTADHPWKAISWLTFVEVKQRIEARPELDVRYYVGAEHNTLAGFGELSSVLNNVRASEAALRPTGAFEMAFDAERLPALLGDSDEPEDTFLEDTIDDWSVGVRVHAIPTDDRAASAAYYKFISRRDAELRVDFDSTCEATAATLRSFWSNDPPLPNADQTARGLWDHQNLRAAICKRRRAADLVAPYAATETPR